MIVSWAISFTIFALIAAALGHSHAAATMGLIATTCFVLFLLLDVVRPVVGSDRNARPTPT
jgi:uncharacterized membrane protein YtjA (UPF0391 family)